MVESAFATLREALSTAPVLQLPAFYKLFIIQCDASGTGFGMVLHQGAGPLAYVSHPFAQHGPSRPTLAAISLGSSLPHAHRPF
ncbi:hypothetical protein U9M48_039155 [Paspalum notatum var. saurae]|uniref:Reverse transcriptase/retrotransposon-derived protein RNase H-like domain-containing protein n=1 Tax=Paspalum notatum var. saurae TaxID=547442 RepID=A0AAQ3UJ16_PASNO